MNKEYVSAGRSPEKYSVVSQYASSSNGRGNGDDYNDNHKRDQRKKKHSRSRSRDRGREREKKKKRDRSRDRERDHGHNRKREKDRSSRDNDVDRDRRKRDKDRDRERGRDFDRDSRSRRSRSRTHESYDSRRRRRRERSHSHVDHEEHEHSRRSPREKSNRYRKEQIKEEARETRFDLTQTIQELMSTTSSSKNFAALFNCNNSNDSISNGPSENSQDDTERKRRKKSRWGGTENDKTFIPGMPTILPSSLDPTQQEAYLVQLQIEEISRKLRTGELGIPQNPEERSPSPEPIYSSDGKRLNTREFRYRKKLEEQRHQLIQKMQSVNPEFKPPADYKPPITRVIDKVLIPQEQHPDINFVGLLIGPRGNTLKAMEKETGAKIIIRGKGSVKEGKVGRKDGQPLAGEDEPLHAFITAPNPEAVKRAVDKIKDVIRQGIEVPEGHNDLRRMQLRELAQLNGTLRETDCPRCTNCGSTEHKSWLCPDKPNITNSIVCTACGGAGHISKDCRSKRPGAVGDESVENVQAKIDEEYMSLMAELGEGPPPPVQQKQSDPLAQVHINRGYSIFDKKTTAMQAIQAPLPPVPSGAPPLVSAVGGVMMSVAPPPPVPPGWNQTNGSAMAPMMPPPPNIQPPPTPAPQIMPWMNAVQPPPPGGDPPPPPGTSPLAPPGTVAPMPPLIPPPPGTTIPTVPLPPWPMPSGYPSWGTPHGVYAPPPPPPPCTPPPPGIGSLGQPPPPPPPSN